jgi:tetratricopeptide (TPR) repeat protein
MSVDVTQRASALLEIGRPEQAIELLQRALASDPDNPHLLDELAVAQSDVDPKAGYDTARSLLALQPDGYRGPYLAAYCCDQLGRRKDAVAYARKAVSAAPHQAATHALLATIVSRRSSGRKEGERAAKAALELAPHDSASHVAAGNVDLHHGRLRQAARHYQDALALDPNDRLAQLNLAVAQEGRGRLAHAFDDVDSLLHFDPQDASVRQRLDDLVHTTIVHLLWVALVLLWIIGAARGL